MAKPILLSPPLGSLLPSPSSAQIYTFYPLNCPLMPSTTHDLGLFFSNRASNIHANRAHLLPGYQRVRSINVFSISLHVWIVFYSFGHVASSHWPCIVVTAIFVLCKFWTVPPFLYFIQKPYFLNKTHHCSSSLSCPLSLHFPNHSTCKARVFTVILTVLIFILSS